MGRFKHLHRAAFAVGALFGLMAMSPAQVQFGPYSAHGQGYVSFGESCSSTAPIFRAVAGGTTTIAIRADNTFAIWGASTGPSLEAVLPKNMIRPLQIAAGETHLLAMQPDGSLVAWGDNSKGECTIPAGLTFPQGIAAGNMFSLALTQGGVLNGWGDQSNKAISMLPNLSGLRAIAAGSAHGVAITGSGGLVSWGDDSVFQVSNTPQISNAVMVSAAGNHSLALDQTGQVYAWGDSSNGLNTLPAGLTGQRVLAVACGDTHSLALTASGKVFAWGDNNLQECTIPTLSAMPVGIAAGNGESMIVLADGSVVVFGLSMGVPNFLNAVSGATGGYSALSLQPNGTVSAWGENGFGNLNVPGTATNVVSVAASDYNCLALRADNTVIAWGAAQSGINKVPSPLSAIAIAAAGEHAMALTTMGQVVCWGDPTGNVNAIPAGLTGQTVKAIAAGALVSMALTTTGQIFVWGDTNDGQATIPPQVVNPVAIAAGDTYCLALQPDGTVVAWGYNGEDQTHVPPGLNNVVSIAASFSTAIAVKADGTVVTWGANPPLALTRPGVTAIASDAILYQYGVYVSIAPYQLAGGTSATGTVSIPQALGQDAQVTLSAADPNLTLSTATVTIPAGKTSAPFTVNAAYPLVNPDTTYVTAALGSSSSVATVTLVPPTLSGLTLSTNTAYVPSTTVTGTVTLNGPAPLNGLVINLKSSDPSVGVQQTVTVLGKQTTANFPLTFNNLTPPKMAIITAQMTTPGPIYSQPLNVLPLLANMQINPVSLKGGATATGTINFNGPAGSAFDIGLKNSDPSATVNATVPVSAGAKSVTFPITTNPVFIITQSTITATATDPAASQMVSAPITVLPPLMTFTLTGPNPVPSGLPCFGLVTFDTPPPASTITVTSNQSYATVQTPLITVTPGQLSYDVVVESTFMLDDGTATITANWNGDIENTTLKVKAPVVSLEVSPSTVYGGQPSIATVRFSEQIPNGWTLYLKSSDPSATITSSITNGLGIMATLTITTTPVAKNVHATISAGLSLQKMVTEPLTILPTQISKLAIVGAGPYYGNTPCKFVVTLNGNAPKGGFLMKMSANGFAVKPSVTIPAGLNTITFDATIQDTATSGFASMIATPTTALSYQTDVNVSPNVPKSLTLSPNSLKGGSATACTGTVTLDAAVATNTTVSISSSNTAAASVPSTVTVLAGKSQANFKITTHAVSKTASVKISAKRFTTSVSQTLSVTH